MNKVIRVILIIMAALLVVTSITFAAIYISRGNLKNVALSDEFQTGIAAESNNIAQADTARIMSANLLVHYQSWGGTPAKPRAKMFMELLHTYQPDVVGLQEISEEWFSTINQNTKGSYKFLFPISTGSFVRMTAMIYNETTLNLIESGQSKYTQGDNPRLRRVVWGVFERKSDGMRFAVTSTHYDLIREGKEEAEFNTMSNQVDEMLKVVSDIESKFNCPVFSTGDFNAMEDGRANGDFDAPKIYEKLVSNLTDTKTLAITKMAGADWAIDLPTYDHIFLKGNAEIQTFRILSEPYITPMSDHYPIFVDVKVK